MKKRNLLLLCQHFYPEMVSTGLHMTELTTRLVKLFPENDIRVFCSNPSKSAFKQEVNKFETFEGVKIYRTGNRGEEHGKGLWGRFIFAFRYFISAFIFTFGSRKEIDLIIITTNPPFIGFIALLMKVCFAKPYLLITYDIYPDIAIKLGVIKGNSLIAGIWDMVTKSILRNADSIVVIGDDMKKIVESKVPSKLQHKICLIHNWADTDQVYPVEKKNNKFLIDKNFKDKDILLYSGNMGRTHNIEELLAAAKELSVHENIFFIFIGSGEKRKLVEQHIANKVSDNVLLLAFQPLALLSDTLSAATLSLICLEDEFTGLSVPSKTYGCMAAGTPIFGLLSSESEISQTIVKHNCGFVHNNESKMSLPDLILEALSDKTLLSKMGSNSRRAFLTNYELSVSATKYNQEIIGILH
jgi:glycosyltransferase involved in cell wall biosynthesis